jgi:hypothetical protein
VEAGTRSGTRLELGSVLAEMGEHELTIRDFGGTSKPSCHEQVSAGNIEDQTLGTGQIGRRYFADGCFAEDKPNPMSAVWNRFRMDHSRSALSSPNFPPDLPDVKDASA